MSVIERDQAAQRVAEALWPQRYVGDVSTVEWERCYAVVDAANAQLQGAVEQIAELERLLRQANIEREDWKRWCLGHEAEVGRLRAALGEQ